MKEILEALRTVVIKAEDAQKIDNEKDEMEDERDAMESSSGMNKVSEAVATPVASPVAAPAASVGQSYTVNGGKLPTPVAGKPVLTSQEDDEDEEEKDENPIKEELLTMTRSQASELERKINVTTFPFPHVITAFIGGNDLSLRYHNEKVDSVENEDLALNQAKDLKSMFSANVLHSSFFEKMVEQATGGNYMAFVDEFDNNIKPYSTQINWAGANDEINGQWTVELTTNVRINQGY